MGDKSPKSKVRMKNQEIAHKKQKKAAAAAKDHPTSATPAKQGK